MKICQFNFNNEVDAFEIHVEDDGRVSVPDGNGGVLGTYDSVEQLAEIYAQARGVKNENLKNWVLLENGNEYTFVLRAGTAGLNVSEAYDQIEEAINSLNGYHPLSIVRAKEQILGDGDKDVTEALVHCAETDIARDVYDRLAALINGEEPAEVAEPEEVDNRSDLQKYVDEMAETPGALAFLASVAGLSVDTDKNDIAAALSNSYVLSNVESLRALYRNAISDARNEGMGVKSDADALTVINQVVAAEKDEEMKARIVATAKMARRSKVNVPVDIVGRKHIKHTAEMVAVEDIQATELYVRGNVAFIVRFDEGIDAELEAERDEANVGQKGVYDENGYDEDGYDRDGYDDDGYDRDGYDRDGYDRDGVDADGYGR